MLVVHEHVLTKGGKSFSLLFRLIVDSLSIRLPLTTIYFSLRAESPNLSLVPLLWPLF